MKKHTLFLTSIIPALLISACGGSSSGTDKPVVLATAPNVTVITETTIKRLTNFTLSATAIDANNDINDILWQQTDGPATVNIVDNNALITSVDFPSIAGKYTFSITVSDSGNLSTSKDVEINVTNTALLDWLDCSIADIEGGRAGAECHFQNVPLDWQNPKGRSIDNLVIRYLAPQQPAKGKVWMLDGGPGGNSSWMLKANNQQAFDINEWDLYIPIHRGVEGPSKLECDGSSQAATTCFNELMSEYEGELAAFNTENAAYDLADIIDKTKQSTESDIVYGASYGTFLAQKYLQQQELAGNTQIDGLILDSVAPLSFQAIDMAANYDVIGLRVLELCNENEFCRQQLGGDPVLFLDNALEKLALENCLIAGDTENIFTVHLAKSLLDKALSSYKDIVPGIIKMMGRCNVQDQMAFAHAYKLLVEDATDGDDTNFILMANVISTNMHRPVMSKEELIAYKTTLKFTSNDTPFYDMTDIWPLDAKPLNATLPATSVPLLILNGGLDPQSTDDMAKQVFDDYAGAQKSIVIFPSFHHGVITQDRINDRNCIANILKKFMNKPMDNIDSQCAEATFTVDVSIESEYMKAVFNYLFGLTSPW
jgi:pimeloyl-ACP methyl ester carboxylesterase